MRSLSSSGFSTETLFMLVVVPTYLFISKPPRPATLDGSRSTATALDEAGGGTGVGARRIASREAVLVGLLGSGRRYWFGERARMKCNGAGLQRPGGEVRFHLL